MTPNIYFQRNHADEESDGKKKKEEKLGSDG